MRFVHHARTLLATACLALAGQAALGQDESGAAPAAAPPAPPSNVEAKDHPFDGGHQIDLSWELSPDDPQPEINAILEAAGVFAVSQLTEERQREVRGLQGTFGGYKIYRSMTEAEVEAANDDALTKGIAGAKADATSERLEALGVEDFHDLTDAQLQEIRAAREAAASAKRAEIESDIAAKAGQTQWQFVGLVAGGVNSMTIDQLHLGDSYIFRVEAVGPGGEASQPLDTTSPLSPTQEFFAGSRFWLLIITLLLCGAVMFWIAYARRGHPVRVRKIAGLEAVDEAVGRATEMGRSILFVPGIQDMNDIQTIAGITVLARVARTAAEYDAKVEVPTSRSLVMTTARETVQSAYLAAGRPDAYNEDRIYYVTDEQFGYVAYLSGLMVRTRPAACFYMGSFFAESLILAETGNAVGAIQVAGTAQPAQLPFFVAACDYTLIGEEFFAASAYLSGSPEELGSLKGQDLGKLIVGAFMIVGIILMTLAMLTGSELMAFIAEFIRAKMLT